MPRALGALGGKDAAPVLPPEQADSIIRTSNTGCTSLLSPAPLQEACPLLASAKASEASVSFSFPFSPQCLRHPRCKGAARSLSEPVSNTVMYKVPVVLYWVCSPEIPSSTYSSNRATTHYVHRSDQELRPKQPSQALKNSQRLSSTPQDQHSASMG